MSNVVRIFPMENKATKEFNQSIQTLNDQLVAIEKAACQFDGVGYKTNEARQKQAELLKGMSSRLMWLSYGLHQQARGLIN